MRKICFVFVAGWHSLEHFSSSKEKKTEPKELYGGGSMQHVGVNCKTNSTWSMCHDRHKHLDSTQFLHGTNPTIPQKIKSWWCCNNSKQSTFNLLYLSVVGLHCRIKDKSIMKVSVITSLTGCIHTELINGGHLQYGVFIARKVLCHLTF